MPVISSSASQTQIQEAACYQPGVTQRLLGFANSLLTLVVETFVAAHAQRPSK